MTSFSRLWDLRSFEWPQSLESHEDDDTRKDSTTGQVAKICKVAPRTVSKWFDSGRLKGYRIPGSQDRRIPREQLIRFLKEHGMPLGDLEQDDNRLILLSKDAALSSSLQAAFAREVEGQFEVAETPFEVGMKMSNGGGFGALLIDLRGLVPEEVQSIVKGANGALKIALIPKGVQVETNG